MDWIHFDSSICQFYIKRVSHDPLAEQRRKLLELLLQTQAKRNHIKSAERARQSDRIPDEPKRTDAEQIETPRTRNQKSAGNDDRDFVVGFTTAAAAAATGDTASEGVASVRYYELSRTSIFKCKCHIVRHPHHSPERKEKGEHFDNVDSNSVLMQLLT